MEYLIFIIVFIADDLASLATHRFDGLATNYGISNTTVLEIAQFTTKTVIYT